MLGLLRDNNEMGAPDIFQKRVKGLWMDWRALGLLAKNIDELRRWKNPSADESSASAATVMYERTSLLQAVHRSPAPNSSLRSIPYLAERKTEFRCSNQLFSPDVHNSKAPETLRLFRILSRHASASFSQTSTLASLGLVNRNKHDKAARFESPRASPPPTIPCALCR
ncbi:hypothetical protein LSTR_LSTR003534 [Laodelphax striatellus]|uniref:Uncharacterized protein n=1 Tax=Laodelphax striatellus TaxID=195883 RepID=A0A482WKT8_LAOST|nr:hypothetical protein LSTR_LSTR003534 [Laodelphax striatellus]